MASATSLFAVKVFTPTLPAVVTTTSIALWLAALMTSIGLLVPAGMSAVIVVAFVGAGGMEMFLLPSVVSVK